MYRFVILAVLAAVNANVYTDTYCPVVKPVEDFNIQAFGNGIWYEVARYPNDAEKGGQCSSAEYKLMGETIHLKNIDLADGRPRIIEGTAKMAHHADTSGQLTFSLPYGNFGAHNEFSLKVLKTDYDNYAINYFCRYNPMRKSRQDFAWIFSRTKTLAGEAKVAVEKYLKESKIVDASKLEWVDFSEQSCRVHY